MAQVLHSSIHFRKAIFSFEEFLHNYDPQSELHSDITYLTGLPRSYGDYYYTRPTLINDLNLTKEEIYKRFTPTTRNEINQVNKSGLCGHRIVEKPSKSELADFYARYV